MTSHDDVSGKLLFLVALIIHIYTCTQTYNMYTVRVDGVNVENAAPLRDHAMAGFLKVRLRGGGSVQ